MRRAIHAAACPQAAFYHAWTLYEALYKLASLNGEMPTGIFATRLARLAPHGDAHAWLWQSNGWTLAITSYVPTLAIRTLPDLSLTKHEWR